MITLLLIALFMSNCIMCDDGKVGIHINLDTSLEKIKVEYSFGNLVTDSLVGGIVGAFIGGSAIFLVKFIIGNALQTKTEITSSPGWTKTVFKKVKPDTWTHMKYLATIGGLLGGLGFPANEYEKKRKDAWGSMDPKTGRFDI